MIGMLCAIQRAVLVGYLQGFRRRSLLRLLSKKRNVEEGPTYIPLPMC